MNVVIYARVSSQGNRQSTERQVSDLKRYAKQREYTIERIFEEHISGKKNNRERKILQDCIAYCSERRIDMLMITEMSRLGRTTLEVLKTLEVLHQKRVNVYIQNINMETLSPDGSINPITSIITTILAELANIEWQGIVDRLRSGRKQYIEKGGKIGRKKGSEKTAEKMKEEYGEAIKLLNKKYSIRNVAKLTEHSTSTIQKVKNLFCKSKSVAELIKNR